MTRTEDPKRVVYAERRTMAAVGWAFLAVLLLLFGGQAWRKWEADRAAPIPDSRITILFGLAILSSALGAAALATAVAYQRQATTFLIDRAERMLHVTIRPFAGRTLSESFALEKVTGLRVERDPPWDHPEMGGSFCESIWIDPRSRPPVLFHRTFDDPRVEGLEIIAEQLRLDLDVKDPVHYLGYED